MPLIRNIEAENATSSCIPAKLNNKLPNSIPVPTPMAIRARFKITVFQMGCLLVTLLLAKILTS
ncbi:MAG: hypothetical protein H8E34_04280 [Bacteroidetes bacterium]|nr:hypothetical protein [Bacteroidota bacterium]MBL6943253.1 hypothetical protein [Bacteroidales bacterium]